MKPETIQYPKKRKKGNFQEIWLAGGCFWGTEHYFSLISGVESTAVGYANGNKENPSYKDVGTGATGFAETVYIQYNPEKISLSFLLELYYKTINPFLLNRQGGDIGTQYRTGIYYLQTEAAAIVQQSLAKLQEKSSEKVVIEQGYLESFFLAEEYHQEYLINNPRGYCHIPRALFDFAKLAKEYSVKSKEELKSMLTPTQYKVTQEDETEPAFGNEYYDESRKGIYVSITTGQPLFASTDKFDAGCGWPAFSRPLNTVLLSEHMDTSGGRIRTEIRSTLGDDHLGHVFSDGPVESGGLRYCINSAALEFVPLEQMKDKGYEDYIPYVK